jgi:hypothetical protein
MAVAAGHARPLRPSGVAVVYQGEPDEKEDDPDVTELLGRLRVKESLSRNFRRISKFVAKDASGDASRDDEATGAS